MSQKEFQPYPELVPREELLAVLGVKQPVRNDSWSQDNGEAVIFNTWQHLWERDASGSPLRYLVRTKDWNPPDKENAQRDQRAGYTQWHEHLDLAISGKRKAFAIVPVATDPTTTLNKGWEGWEKTCIVGSVKPDTDGNLWLNCDEVKTLIV